MRTTISIDDGLLKTAKQRAETEGITLGTLIERALQEVLMVCEEVVESGPPLPFFTRGTGLAPDLDPTSNASMLDALDEEDDSQRQARAAG